MAKQKPNDNLNNKDTASVDLSKPGQGNSSDVKEQVQETARSQDDHSMEEPDKSHSLVLALLGVFLAAVLLGGGWYFYSIQEDEADDVATVEEQEEEEEVVEEEPSFTLVVTVDSIDTEEAMPTITGTVNDPEAEVLVTVDDSQYTAEVDEDGNWSVTVTEELSAGTYQVSVTASSESAEADEQASGQVIVSEPEVVEEEPEDEQEEEVEEEEAPEELPQTGGGGDIPVY